MEFTAMTLTKAGILFDVSSFGAQSHQGSKGWEMSGMARSTFACWCDVRAVFMQHHKYACCFVWHRGIYDSTVTAFALSEVIYLSSTLTVSMDKIKDNYMLHINKTNLKTFDSQLGLIN